MKNYVKTIARKREFGIVIMVFVLATLLTCMSDAFLQWDNIKDFLRSNAVIGIMAFGMLPVLISGGIDLSVSATIALSAVVLGKFLVAFPNANPIFAFIVVIAIGGLVGIINGIIITKFKIAPIVATLGTMTIIQGFVLFYTGGFLINGLPDWFKKFGGITVGLPVQVLLFVFMGIITAFILRKTLIGRGIYAVGGSQSSAIRVGYNVDKILVFIYFYAGVLSGIAAFVHISIIGQVDPNTYTGYELDVISHSSTWWCKYNGWSRKCCRNDPRGNFDGNIKERPGISKNTYILAESSNGISDFDCSICRCAKTQT